MDKIYQLLRNNQQSGPYTKEELIQLPLKPFDLIWATGITAGWMYPTEIDILKPYVAEIKQEPGKGSEPVAAAPLLPVAASPASPDISEPVLAQHNPAPPAGKHIFISLPGGENLTKPSPHKTAVPVQPIEGAEETPEQQLERKAMELRQKVQAFAAAKKVEGEEPSLDTKYERSLDDIKEEYTHWMHEQKTKRRRPSFSKRQILAAGILLILAGVGYTGSKWFFRPDKMVAGPIAAPTQTILPPRPSAAPTQERASENGSVINTEYTGRNAAVLKELEQANKLIEEDLKRFDRNGSVALSKTPDDAAEDVSIPDSYEPVTQPMEEAPPITQHKERTTTSEPPVRAASQRTQSKPLNQQLDINAKYLKAARGKGLDGLELTLRNNSNQVLKAVAIDVFYYREDNHQLAKETVYFNNVSPGESGTLIAPGHKRASSATYQLGLISTDAGLYVAKQ